MENQEGSPARNKVKHIPFLQIGIRGLNQLKYDLFLFLRSTRQAAARREEPCRTGYRHPRSSPRTNRIGSSRAQRRVKDGDSKPSRVRKREWGRESGIWDPGRDANQHEEIYIYKHKEQWFGRGPESEGLGLQLSTGQVPLCLYVL